MREKHSVAQLLPGIKKNWILDLHGNQRVRWCNYKRMERDDGWVRIILERPHDLHLVPSVTSQSKRHVKHSTSNEHVQ
jgi:hypothetical protein